jgi:hypothetical protein
MVDISIVMLVYQRVVSEIGRLLLMEEENGNFHQKIVISIRKWVVSVSEIGRDCSG